MEIIIRELMSIVTFDILLDFVLVFCFVLLAFRIIEYRLDKVYIKSCSIVFASHILSIVIFSLIYILFYNYLNRYDDYSGGIHIFALLMEFFFAFDDHFLDVYLVVGIKLLSFLFAIGFSLIMHRVLFRGDSLGRKIIWRNSIIVVLLSLPYIYFVPLYIVINLFGI